MIESAVLLSDKINNAVVEKPNIENQFNEFWKTYPTKVGKKAALAAWKKLKPDKELQAKILAAIQKQKNSDSWQRGYIPHPSRWLRDARWEDEITWAGDSLYAEAGEHFIPSQGFRR